MARRDKRLGDHIEYDALIGVHRLEVDKPDAIVVAQRMGLEPSEHYTRVEIEDLHRTFRGRSLSSIRENTASMYRRDIDSGDITIRWNGEPFEWEGDPVFEEKTPDGSLTRWDKNVQFDVDGYDVTGRVWIRMPGQANRAGMHLFRRNRLVVGGPGSGYKPREIFAAPNSFQSQRLIGELNLDNWPVTQTKDAFDWAGELVLLPLEYDRYWLLFVTPAKAGVTSGKQPWHYRNHLETVLETGFISKLSEAVAEYVEKTRGIKADPDTRTTSADGQLTGDNTKGSLQGSEVDSTLTIVETGPPPPRILSQEALERLERSVELSGNQPTYVQLGTEGVPTLKIYWLDDLPSSDIHAHFDIPSDQELLLYINLNHPFVERVISREPAKLELYAHSLYADALVESGIRKRGQNVPAHTFRHFKDAFLRVINPGSESV